MRSLMSFEDGWSYASVYNRCQEYTCGVMWYLKKRAFTDGTFCHPHATLLPCARLLNDLVCQDQKGWRDHDPQGLSGLEVNDELELHGLLHGRVPWFRP